VFTSLCHLTDRSDSCQHKQAHLQFSQSHKSALSYLHSQKPRSRRQIVSAKSRKRHPAPQPAQTLANPVHYLTSCSINQVKSQAKYHGSIIFSTWTDQNPNSLWGRTTARLAIRTMVSVIKANKSNNFMKPQHPSPICRGISKTHCSRNSSSQHLVITCAAHGIIPRRTINRTVPWTYQYLPRRTIDHSVSWISQRLPDLATNSTTLWIFQCFPRLTINHKVP
jgi:hypothetical protein